MARNICVVGTGYVGLLTAVGLADFGNQVVGVDIDKTKVASLNAGKPNIFEPGIEDYLSRNLAAERLRFTTEIGPAVEESEIIFVAVGTPSTEDGEADLSALETVIRSIGEHMNGYKVIVIKSTVPVGTNRRLSETLGAKAGIDFDIVSNPEFLREGKAVYDFFHPDRVVIGFSEQKAKEIMEDVYRTLNRINVPFVWCNWETAEIIKYSSNGFLALKICFINQIACLAEKSDSDIQTIAKAIGMDSRIGSKFLHAGPGYGGSCFPKDTRALASMGRSLGAPLSLIETVIEANEHQKQRVFARLKQRIAPLAGKTIGILGLAFKAETDDIRESAAIPLVSMLIKEEATIQAHDPKAMKNFSESFPTVKYMNSEYDAVKGCDAIVILTEWNEYRSLDLGRTKSLMRAPYIFDTRNVVDRNELDDLGFSYDLIGRPGK